MNTTEPIRIPLSKTKLWLTLLGCGLFVALCGWYLIAPPDAQFLFVRGPLMIRLMGLIGLVFFGGIGVFLVRKLGDSNSGLVVSDTGFTDNSSGVSAGFVPWADVTSIREHSLFGQHFLLVFVRDPDVYINRQTSTLKRRGMAMNHKQNGTPISLNAGTLQTNFAGLSSLLGQRLLAYQAGTIGSQPAPRD